MTISLIVFACISGGTLLGMILRALLPKHHLSNDTKDAIRLGIGMIATMAALVLGLLISSAKGTFDTFTGGIRNTGTKIIFFDHTMANYGPETREARDILKDSVITSIEQIWPGEKKAMAVEKVGSHQSTTKIADLEEKLRQLSPRNDDQRRLQSLALQIHGEIREGLWHMYEQIGQSSIATPFLVLLVCWLTIIFASFGLFTSPNTTVIIILFICALSAASALFLILELDQPYGGLIQISSAPLHNALARIGQ
jgi:hypothetical protein